MVSLSFLPNHLFKFLTSVPQIISHCLSISIYNASNHKASSLSSLISFLYARFMFQFSMLLTSLLNKTFLLLPFHTKLIPEICTSFCSGILKTSPQGNKWSCQHDLSSVKSWMWKHILLKPKLGHALTASLLPGLGTFTDKTLQLTVWLYETAVSVICFLLLCHLLPFLLFYHRFIMF